MVGQVDLVVATLNVRGCRQATRRTAIFESLESVSFDMLFLQECHLHSAADATLFSAGWRAGPSVWGVGEGKADGVGILFRSWDFNVGPEVVVVPGRVLSVDGTWRGVTFRAICVYAPTQRGERKGFFSALEPLLCTNKILFLGGDLNVNLGKERDLQSMLTSVGLVDSGKGCGEGVVTWRNSRGDASRLDYIMVSRRVRVVSYRVCPFWASDHCLVKVVGEVRGVARGPGLWRFNISYLQDQVFQDAFRRLYMGWQSLKVLYSTLAEWWESTKGKVARFCQWWGRKVSREEREKTAQWSRALQTSWNSGNMEGVRLASGALRKYYLARAKSFCIQAGRQRLQLDERPTRFFFDTVRVRQRRSCIERLREGENFVTSAEGMLERAAAYYEDLFQARPMAGAQAEGLLETLTQKVSQEDREFLDAALSEEEVEGAMRALRTGVAPGGDGLPVEWYRAFWPLVGRDIVAVFREALKQGQMSESARTGHITLLYKKGDRTDLANWRPITLLCADYKILAKVLTLRLRGVIDTVVHPDQTCGIPGRSISMSLALIRDAIAWVQQRKLPLALLGLDQEKAFDRVNLKFLFATLSRMGFGENFLSLVQLLYSGAVSRVGVNGYYSRPVAQVGGVRQGCPLSPLLYVLYLEPLLNRLRHEPSFVGLHIPGGRGEHAKVAAYADDATLFLASDGEFGAVERVLGIFTEATGARVNREKSSVQYMGSWAGRTDVPSGFFLCPDGLRILGVRFWRESSATKNWEAALEWLQAKTARWASRDLSLTGRVVVVNCDLFASLIHLAYVFPIPFWTGRRIERLLFSFIWGGRNEWVARSTMYLEVEKGGRGVVCAPLKLAALFVSFLGRLVQGSEGHRASLFARFWFGFTLRMVIPWKGTVPWSTDWPDHYQKAVHIVKGQPWCLEGSVVLDHRRLYQQWRIRHVETGIGERPGLGISWVALQPKWLNGASKDLHWLGALGRLPVRERLYRHGRSDTAQCPVGCGGEERIDHALWACPTATRFWQEVSVWWARRDGAPITRDLVLYGHGAKKSAKLWLVVSAAKVVLWGARCGCVRRRRPGIDPGSLFQAFLRRMDRMEGQECEAKEEERKGVG